MRTYGQVYETIVINLIIACYSSAIFKRGHNNAKFISEMTGFSSVTTWEGIERYYKELRKTNRRHYLPLEPATEKARKTVQNGICRSIFTSHFFEMRSEEYLDTDDEQVRNELRSDYPVIYWSIFGVSENPTTWFEWGDDYEYDNVYQERKVHVGNVAKYEHTFRCVVRCRERVRDYFVSREYNVNVVHDGLPIIGRFIFSRNSLGNVALLASAEEAAAEANFLRKSSLLDIAYIAFRENERRVSTLPTTHDTDPVCGLTAANKLRLCSSLFAATSSNLFWGQEPAFKRSELKFAPVIDRNYRRFDDCILKQVFFASAKLGTFGLLTKTILRLSHNRTYLEWMVPCNAFKRDEGDPVVYYVSRGYQKNNAFVYVDNDTDGQVSLYNLFMNMNVIARTRSDLENPPQGLTDSDTEDQEVE